MWEKAFFLIWKFQIWANFRRPFRLNFHLWKFQRNRTAGKWRPLGGQRKKVSDFCHPPAHNSFAVLPASASGPGIPERRWTSTGGIANIGVRPKRPTLHKGSALENFPFFKKRKKFCTVRTLLAPFTSGGGGRGEGTFTKVSSPNPLQTSTPDSEEISDELQLTLRIHVQRLVRIFLPYSVLVLVFF